MDMGQKLAAGLLLISAGVIWLFFVVIWLPPLTMLTVLIGIKMGLSDTFYGKWLLLIDIVTALSVMGYGAYLLLRCRRIISG